jgi:hypothetical protein
MSRKSLYDARARWGNGMLEKGRLGSRPMDPMAYLSSLSPMNGSLRPTN